MNENYYSVKVLHEKKISETTTVQLNKKSMKETTGNIVLDGNAERFFLRARTRQEHLLSSYLYSSLY